MGTIDTSATSGSHPLMGKSSCSQLDKQVPDAAPAIAARNACSELDHCVEAVIVVGRGALARLSKAYCQFDVLMPSLIPWCCVRSATYLSHAQQVPLTLRATFPTTSLHVVAGCLHRRAVLHCWSPDF
jgi:hypothetical protein